MTVVRPATPDDARAILEVERRAFPTETEARLVEALERDGDVLLSLVAERDGRIVGHLLFSRMDVEADGSTLKAAALGPVAVLPEMQGTGIGSALIEDGLRRVGGLGVVLVLVLGEPDYYRRFGFDTALGARFASPYAGAYWMGLALGGQAWSSGVARHAPAFAALGEET